MSDTHTIGPELTPSEAAYFESGGTTEVEAPQADSSSGDDSASVDAGSEQQKGSERKAPPGYVDQKALDEERTRRKERDRENRQLSEQLAELRGKFSIIEKLQSGSQDNTQELTPETDIFGFAKKTHESVDEIRKRLDAQEMQDRQRAEQDAIVGRYQVDAAKFAQANPDFGSAYNYLLTARANELVAMGYDNPTDIHNALVSDEMAIAQMALGRDKSPAQMIYELAQQRGYKKPQADKSGDAAARLDTIERGQNANKSLSNTGGTSGDGDITAAMLLKMPNDEFEAWCEKHPAKAKKIFGG